MAAVDRLNGLIQSLAIKAPCRVATTANLTAMNGLLTIDGVVLAQDDRVLVKNQTDATQNGIYKVDTGDWSRDLDCDGSGDLMQGTIVFVIAGTVGGSSVWQVTSVNPVIVGSSNITFAATGSAALAIASAYMLNTFFPITTAALALAALGGAKLAGGNTFTGTQAFSNLVALSAALNEAKGADIASGTTTDLGAATGNFVHVTGTTTISGLGTIQSGTRRKVVFDGALVITHNATSLICLGGASITTAAGDCAEFESEGSGNWRMTSYERKSGAALFAFAGGVRQTVQSGPVDTAGLPTFLTTSANLNLTSQNLTSTPLVCNAAGGANSGGSADRFGYSAANLTWTGLTASQTNYLYVLVGADGMLTTGFTILAPVYQWGGTPSVTNGQITFNISEMKAYLGNGAAAAQTYLVIVGEAVCSGSAVTSTVPYAYNGQYESAFTSTLPSTGTTTTSQHNLGIMPRQRLFVVECISADAGFSVGEQLDTASGLYTQTTIGLGVSVAVTVKAMAVSNATTTAFAATQKSGANNIGLTAAKWKYKFVAARGW